MRWLFNLLYGGDHAEFDSAFGVEESIARLAANSRRSVFSSLTQEVAVGPVSKDRVCLQRVKPFFGNSFKPFYVGEFRESKGRVTLSGRFTMHWWAKAFMTFWLGFCLWVTVVALASVLSGDEGSWLFLLAGAGMFAIGTLFVAFCKWLSRNDIPWLSELIKDALAENSSGN